MSTEKRTCKVCGQEKDIGEFRKRASKGKIYIRHQCISCEREQRRESQRIYRSDPKNRKIHNLKSKEYRAKPENKEKRKEYNATYRQNKKEDLSERQKIYIKTPVGKFRSYKKGARDRNHEFNLSFEEFMTFWQQPCYYCNSSIETIGLDRVDNTKGYVIGNVVSCCKVCNTKKRDLTPKDVIMFYNIFKKLGLI